MDGKINFNKTQESIYTLLSLCTLSVQACETLFGEEDILNADFDIKKPTFKEMANDTIREALIYQILLKSCAYLDEWDKYFGVKTEPQDLSKILLIKKIARPAYKIIASWKQLRDFRNQAIAHNHRDKSGKNIYLTNVTWNSPQSDGEIYLLVFAIKTITDIVNFYYPEVAKMSFSITSEEYSRAYDQDFLEDDEIQETIDRVQSEVSKNLKENGAFD